MHVNDIQMLAVEDLRSSTANPKKPMDMRYRRGLRESLAKFGFAGILVVAANQDGSYEVLDGNTRLEELERQGVEKIPAIVYEGMSTEDRRAFALAHDRNRKVFDEEAVLAQLASLVEKGQDVDALAKLTAKENLARTLAEMANPKQSAGKARENKEVMASMVLYGRADDLQSVRELLARIKGRMLSQLDKLRQTLSQFEKFFDWEDAEFTRALLITIARYRGSDEGS